MFCPNCNYSVQVTDNYCSSCGKKLETLAPKITYDPDYSVVAQKKQAATTDWPILVIGMVNTGITLFWNLFWLVSSGFSSERHILRFSRAISPVSILGDVAIAIICIVFLKNPKYRVALVAATLIMILVRVLSVYGIRVFYLSY